MSPTATNFWKPAMWFVGLCGTVVLAASVAGCGTTRQWDTEARIRGYFGLPRDASLESTNIQSALLQQFPLGTASTTIETSLAQRGMGSDGGSVMWRANNILGCGPRNYSDGWFSKRRISVRFVLDDHGVVTNVKVESYSCGL